MTWCNGNSTTIIKHQHQWVKLSKLTNRHQTSLSSMPYREKYVFSEQVMIEYILRAFQCLRASKSVMVLVVCVWWCSLLTCTAYPHHHHCAYRIWKSRHRVTIISVHNPLKIDLHYNLFHQHRTNTTDYVHTSGTYKYKSPPNSRL